MSNLIKAQANILIVDDEADIRHLIQGILEDEGYACAQAESANACFERVDENTPDLIILDIWLQGSDRDGLEILAQVKKEYPFLPVIMISGHGTIETAVKAIKKGAYDFIEKPFKSDRLLLMIRRALEAAKLQHENKRLKQMRGNNSGAEIKSVVGRSDLVKTLNEQLKGAAVGNSRILFTGERGTGKEMAARLLHYYSERRDGIFSSALCREIKAEEIEPLFQNTAGGTVYLDGVEALSLEGQTTLASFLQSNDIDGRLIVSAGQDLPVLVEEGAFSAALYALINVTEIHAPSLRKRPEDIPDLCAYFMGRSIKSLMTPEAYAVLQGYHWPENVSELRHACEWMRMMHPEHTKSFGVEHLPLYLTGISMPVEGAKESAGAWSADQDVLALSLRDAREMFEKFYLTAQIERFEGNISKTAEFIGMERSALHRKIKNLELHKEETENEASNTIRKRA